MADKRIGIFGGRRGMAFYSVIAKTEGFSLCAICDEQPQMQEAVRKAVGDEVQVCSTWEEMLSLGLDAVILANFFHEHAAYAIQAMERGLDVISETTAAPTLGECLDLVECCERTGRKYMLAANCPTMVGPGELMRVYQSGELGEVLYAEAEYLHPTTEEESLSLAPTESHWRRYIPGTYYNMHSLGVLMTATGLLPKRVTAMEIFTESCRNRATVLNNKSAGGIALYQMDNGSVFRSTGWCQMSPSGKWFRLTCEGGTIETERENQDRVLLRRKGKGVTKYDPDNQYTKEEKKEGHGGADARICRQICDYLSGKVEEPLLDIYRGVTLSMAGIYGLYSILDGKTYDIPDIRNKEEREVLRGDYRSPFPGKDGKCTLPFGKDRV
jgi:predicted dehydrogenase